MLTVIPPDNVSVPMPDFVRLLGMPLTRPDSRRLLALVATQSWRNTTGLMTPEPLDSSAEAPNRPPLITSVLLASADGSARTSTPPPLVVMPLCVLAPASVSVPAPSLVKLPVPASRIVKVLHAAEEVRRLRAEAEAKNAELIPAMFSQYLIRTRLKLKLIRPWFLHAFVRSPIGRSRVMKQARTAAGQSRAWKSGNSESRMERGSVEPHPLTRAQ